MRKGFLYLLLGISSLFADVRVPEPWNPGFFDGEKNPAQRISAFRMGILWTEPMEGADYEVLGFAAEWGNSFYYVGMDFSSAFLDSLYRSENFGLNVSISLGRLTLGVGGSADIQVVPGEASWWGMAGRVGSSVSFGALSGGILGVYAEDLRENAVETQVFWNAGERFQSGVRMLFRQKSGWLWVFQESLALGALSLQGCFAFPGPKIGVGIGFRIKNAGATFGVHRDGSYMNSKMAGIYISKGSQK
ncbi:MAG: hypothetical protein J6Z31_07670 [Fibrobacter sp.]|nr:hypothetical protein [Fibrobacter sp.]